uniref:Uncharacterized protein n=1 Tax=Arundo donax TaxID=35708 RepID=A0A0A9AJ68_ARUDO
MWRTASWTSPFTLTRGHHAGGASLAPCGSGVTSPRR